ncbi:SpoIIAA family protein [Aporhodopirellula aestuarii]|uniref:STAS/SEC14 domain-containing protein n=1 Tax=Aporhodopirellula aestuarii TaxID=2950107 RepID=A0ABT0U100_9BACT|nr:STAS/SEC14 domain-containing protein [Aporhodopirellula aestuarii]MCM2370240.1 STAS/SEC14 domain-containing protein [Aporhodopirellula aestuarii]
MSFNLTEHAEGKIIEVEISGKLSKEAYEAFVPMTEARIKEFGKVRMLVILHDFHGWDAGALWEDIKFDFKHHAHIERLAIVGETKWEKGMATFCKPFTSATIEYFDITDVAKARQWILEDAAVAKH